MTRRLRAERPPVALVIETAHRVFLGHESVFVRSDDSEPVEAEILPAEEAGHERSIREGERDRIIAAIDRANRAHNADHVGNPTFTCRFCDGLEYAAEIARRPDSPS